MIYFLLTTEVLLGYTNAINIMPRAKYLLPQHHIYQTIGKYRERNTNYENI